MLAFIIRHGGGNGNSSAFSIVLFCIQTEKAIFFSFFHFILLKLSYLFAESDFSFYILCMEFSVLFFLRLYFSVSRIDVDLSSSMIFNVCAVKFDSCINMLDANGFGVCQNVTAHRFTIRHLSTKSRNETFLLCNAMRCNEMQCIYKMKINIFIGITGTRRKKKRKKKRKRKWNHFSHTTHAKHSTVHKMFAFCRVENGI